jgi:two-component system sensor histidine kinase QseC
LLSVPHSLRGRLLAGVLGVVSAVWLVATAWAWFDARHELDELLDGHLAQAAALLVVQQTRELDDDHGVDAPTLHRYAPKVAFQVFHEGALVLRSANAPGAPMVAMGDRFENGFKTVQIDGLAWRVFATHGAERDVQVYVGEQTDSRESILWAVARGMLWPMVLALPVMALAAGWVVRRAVAPLSRLGSSLAERPAHDLKLVRVDGAPSEMEPMVDALNGLFERIEALLDGERRFTADAAHELRTPIAAIRAQAQVALTEPAEAPRRHALLATLEGCDRASRLVEQLLTLSRLEAEHAPPLHVVDLSAVARQVVAELAPKAIAKQQLLELDAAAACPVAGDEVLLAVLVRNLVDNAVRYSPPSAQVRVRVAATTHEVVLHVEDSGPGLTETDVQRLGERFFRVSGNAESGSGLGWSIARRIAAVHRATLRPQRSAALAGLAVELSIPSVH